MSEYTDWFLADASEAPELASVPPDELTDRWQAISLKNVLELELRALAKLLLGASYRYESALLFPDDAPSRADDDVTSEQLDGGVYVTHVPETFVRALAALDDAELERASADWRSRADHIRELTKAETTTVLRSMRDFAALAMRTKKSVLTVFEI